jgi:hypothetical protein
LKTHEIALCCTDPENLGALLLSEGGAARVYLGNEFCENLILSRRELLRALAGLEERGLEASLATPMPSDGGIERLARLFEVLPAGTEVIVNDWGVLRLLRKRFPDLVPVAGRLLARQMKDPRLDSPEWSRLVPHGLFSASRIALLFELGFRRMEIDLSPHFVPDAIDARELRLTVHAPYGYCSKGRICRIGSCSLPDGRKFAPGHTCRRECLTYVARMERRSPVGAGLRTFQRGNTLFYRYSDEMARSLRTLLERGRADRLAIAGDWHEGSSAA